MSPPRLKRRVSHEQRRRDFRFLARFRKLLGDHSGVTLERLRRCVRSGNWRRRPVPGMPAQEESINSCISTRLSFQRAAPLAATAIGDVSRMARREPVAGVGAERQEMAPCTRTHCRSVLAAARRLESAVVGLIQLLPVHILCMRSSRSKLISTALRRGLRKRCPHCGEGRLFSGWSQLDRCSICGLVFARNPGDTWAFTIIGDRLPTAAMIVLIYFGVVRSHRVLGLAMLVVLAALVIWTAPNRWGAGIALHYLSRVYWPDPEDSIPPPPATRARGKAER
jgi:uncharacterized protein (DUF983 family)